MKSIFQSVMMKGNSCSMTEFYGNEAIQQNRKLRSGYRNGSQLMLQGNKETNDDTVEANVIRRFWVMLGTNHKEMTLLL